MTACEIPRAPRLTRGSHVPKHLPSRFELRWCSLACTCRGLGLLFSSWFILSMHDTGQSGRGGACISLAWLFFLLTSFSPPLADFAAFLCCRLSFSVGHFNLLPFIDFLAFEGLCMVF